LGQWLYNTDPFYSPVSEPVLYQGKQILIIWVPGGQIRPYKATAKLSVKGEKQYYIRRGSTTVIAKNSEVKQLMELAASIPMMTGLITMPHYQI
jgi:ATP-dependent DNA helicase RecG